MSERVPTETLPLFAPRAPEPVPTIHTNFEALQSEFLDKLRRLLELRYADGPPISTDDVWERMEEWGITIPEGVSYNVMGTLFSGWDRARPHTWLRSKRKNAHGNLIRSWYIT